MLLLRLFVLALLTVSLCGTSRADDRTPAPSTEDAAKAEKLIKELFKADYAKVRTPDRVALAAKLLQQAGETTDDAASRFVLIREARDIAAKAGDSELALKAAGSATLRRYQARTGARREQTPFALTHEAVAKVAGDLAASA